MHFVTRPEHTPPQDVQAPEWLEKKLAKHFDLTQFHAQFFFHAMRMRNRINCGWKTNASWFPWKGYDKMDIATCDQVCAPAP